MSTLMSAENDDPVLELSAPAPCPTREEEEEVAAGQRRLNPVPPVVADNQRNFTPVPPSAHPPPTNKFKRRKFRISPRSDESGSSTNTNSQISSCDASLTASKVRSVASDCSSTVTKLPRLYLGKEMMHVGTLGQFGPGMYDVRSSKTGSPRGVAKGTPRLGNGSRFDRGKCYEGKENAHMLLGQFGPGLYDIRCFNTGSPTGGSKRTPRFGSGARFDRDKCYEGKEHMRYGREGPTATYDPPRCSNRGSPLWRNRPSAAFALPHMKGALRSNPA